MTNSHSFQVNRPSLMDRTPFLTVFGGVYEHSPWIAAQVFDTGLSPMHDTAEALSTALREVVVKAGYDPQLRLLRAHPDLAGRLAMRGELTAESSAEQSSAGLDQCSPEEFEELQSLNEDYQSRFKFPFILAVKGLNRHEIIETFRSRVANDQETEFTTALEQVHRIAYLRLLDIK